MPTWAEQEAEHAAEREERLRDGHQSSAIRTKGAVFIRETGQKLPPYILAQRENKRRARQAAQRKKYDAEQDIVAQSQKAMLLIDLRKQGLAEDEAARMAEETYKKNMLMDKSTEQLQNELRINDEAMRIFNAWDDDADGQLNPAELRQALALAGFNTNTDLVEEIMDEFDTDGDGMMDIDEFKIMMHVLYRGQRRKGFVDNMKVSCQPQELRRGSRCFAPSRGPAPTCHLCVLVQTLFFRYCLLLCRCGAHAAAAAAAARPSSGRTRTPSTGTKC